MSAWRLCMIDGCWAYFAQCAPTEVWGDDWDDAPHECNAEPPYSDSIEGGVLKVAFDGDWKIGGTQCCQLNAPDHPHGYSVQEINQGAMPWLYIPHHGDRYPEIRLSIHAGVTLAEFTAAIKQGDGQVYLSKDGSERHPVAASSSASSSKDEEGGDWSCSDCGRPNREHETFCFVCGAGRPDGGEHEVYADPVEGGWRGYAPACRTCGWRGDVVETKEMADRDAQQHLAHEEAPAPSVSQQGRLSFDGHMRRIRRIVSQQGTGERDIRDWLETPEALEQHARALASVELTGDPYGLASTTLPHGHRLDGGPRLAPTSIASSSSPSSSTSPSLPSRRAAGMGRSEKPRFLVICRAAAKSTGGANAEARLGFVREPDEEALGEFRRGIADMFRSSFGREPARIGVAVLPWVDEIDDPEDESEAGRG